MKKIMAMAAAVLMLITCTAYAASSTKVVIIGGAEFKTKDFYSIAQKVFGSKTKSAYEAGDDIQRKYQMFMTNRYDVGEDKPRKQDMIDFAAENNSRIVFLLVDETIDTQTHGDHRQKNRSTVQVDAYLVNSSQIVDFATTGQEFTSKASNLRARRGAFEKCVKEIASVMNLY